MSDSDNKLYPKLVVKVPPSKEAFLRRFLLNAGIDFEYYDNFEVDQSKIEDNILNLRRCISNDFIVDLKETCSIQIREEGLENYSEFKRLEFQEIYDDDIVLDWLEPVIHDGLPALILHCHRSGQL